MSKNQIDAYNHYKRLCPTAILLFRVGDEYVALFEDSKKVAASLSLTLINDAVPKVSFPKGCLEYITKLADDGYEVQTISVRNDENVFDYPDVKRLEEEKEADY